VAARKWILISIFRRILPPEIEMSGSYSKIEKMLPKD
jgi:hypothetical protein